MSAFFEALRDGRFLGARTVDGRVLLPPCEYDPETGADIAGLVEVGPHGTVTSWSTTPAAADGATPSAWVLVQLDGADTAFLHRMDGRTTPVHTGLRVRPRWAAERVGTLADLVAFEPLP